MPKRLRNQHTAKKRREEKRKLLKRPGISHGRVRKSQDSAQPASVAATATTEPQSVTKPPSQEKIYKLVLIKGPEDENERASWIASIRKVFGKTEAEARGIIFHAEYYDEKPTLFSSADKEEIADLRRSLAWSLTNATKIKE